MGSPLGVTPRKQRGLWYYLGLRSCGEAVFPAVFRASYLGGNIAIKEHILVLMESANKSQKPLTDESKEKLFKKQYTEEQRHKLDNQRPPEEFDITFLHKLLRNSKMCDLAPDDSVWRDKSHPLEYGIQFIKDERNRLSHESQELSEQDFLDIMKNLQEILREILEAAEKRFSVDFSQLYTNICQQLKAIQETDIIDNMDPSNVDHWHKLKEIQKLFREHEEKDVREESMKEIISTYEPLCLVEPAPWLLRDGDAVEPDLIFVTMELEQDDIMHSKEKKKKIIVSHKQLVTVTRPDGTNPNVVVLKGDGGLGKSTLMKLVMHHWLNKTSEIDGLSSYPLVLFTECRDISKQSIDDLLQHYLPQTVRSVNGCERLKEIVLSQPLIIIVDGYDEINPSSEKLLKEILALNGDHIKVFVTTRPISAKQLALILPKTKRNLTLQLLGIDKEHQSLFVTKLMHVLLDDSQRVKEETDGLMEHLHGMAEDVQSILHSPLNLGLIVLIWIESPEKINSLTSMTTLFSAFRELISGKVIERLVNRGLKESKAEEMCQVFLEYYDELAYITHCREEFELKEKTVSELRKKCRDMKLPDEAGEEFLSSYFTMKMSRKLLKITLIYSFRHRSEQEYACANYLATEVTQPSSSQKTIQDVIRQKFADVNDVGKKFERVLLYLTGILHEKEVLDEFGAEIIELVHFETFPYSVETDPLLRHLAECETDSDVARAVQMKLEHYAKIKKSKWRISTGVHLCSLLPLLSSKSVKKLDLYIPENTTTITHLQPALESVVNNDIKLKLELTHNFFKFPLTEATDDSAVEIFSQSGVLEEFRGRISKVGVLLLPESLTTLKLKVGVEDIPHLNKRIPDLWQLSEMTLVMRLSTIPDPNTVSRIEYYGEELWIWLECPTLQDDEAGRAGAMVRNMWPAGERQQYDGVAFFDTHLTAAGIEKLLENLAGGDTSPCSVTTRRKSSVDSIGCKQLQNLDLGASSEDEETVESVVLWVLRIDTSRDISDEDLDRLSTIAKAQDIEELHVY